MYVVQMGDVSNDFIQHVHFICGCYVRSKDYTQDQT